MAGCLTTGSAVLSFQLWISLQAKTQKAWLMQWNRV